MYHIECVTVTQTSVFACIDGMSPVVQADTITHGQRSFIVSWHHEYTESSDANNWSSSRNVSVLVVAVNSYGHVHVYHGTDCEHYDW